MTALSAPAPTGTPATLLTADEFTIRYANVHAELVKGIVKEYPVPWPRQGKIKTGSQQPRHGSQERRQLLQLG